MRFKLNFADTEQELEATRDPVTPVRCSASAQVKAATKTLPDGTPAHGFAALMTTPATILRNTCRTPGAGSDAPIFEILTTPSEAQARALDSLHPIAYRQNGKPGFDAS